jgi:hypothetical protein
MVELRGVDLITLKKLKRCEYLTYKTFFKFTGMVVEPNVVFDTECDVFFRTLVRLVCDRGMKPKTNSAHSFIAYT